MVWIMGIQVSVVARSFTIRHLAQTGSGAHQASYTMGNGGSFPGSKAVRA